MVDLNGKVAVITGGTSGIGYAAAVEMAKCGAKVVAVGLLSEKEKEAIGVVPEGIELRNVNVGSEEEVKEVIAYAAEKYGSVDIAVASAGVSGFTYDVFDTDVWNKTIGINLTGVFYLDKYAIEQMQKQGGGAIVNVASITGLVGNFGTVCYPSSKHGVVGLTKSAALTYIRDGIRVNAVAPGWVKTPLTASLPEDEMAKTEAKIPIGRMAEPEEIAKVVAFLASDDASYLTGCTLPIDGGFTAF